MEVFPFVQTNLENSRITLCVNSGNPTLFYKSDFCFV